VHENRSAGFSVGWGMSQDMGIGDGAFGKAI
jgi:hypothetical protein